ncbi:MAG: cyclic nucleotide-binding domain-containing protein [Polyangiaceae bacterium]|nr:cyclic nucleotide-binding domain-containing protein [Myxococcales bacterium]MCB9590634.1 cyclic nucleotide-binding domain-containing protein [Polyangiaceae bacterium]MCB9608100.1 cyclic nucleotide-binding domain-containing protein [Polyangiaceae bacterium]
MAAPPPLPTKNQPNVIDRAIGLACAGKLEEALRWVVAELNRDATGGVAALLTSRWMAELGRENAARTGFETCVTRAIAAGQLPVAVAACAELRRFGGDATACYQQIAKAYSEGSASLGERPMEPPALGGAQEVEQPLPESFRGDALLDEAGDALEAAKQALPSEAPRDLPQQPLFSSLGEGALAAFVEIFELQLVDAEERVINEGELGTSAYVVVRGELEVSKHGADAEVRLARLGGGALVGEMALISRAPRAASVGALRPSLLLSATKESLDALAEREPAIGDEFASRFRRRMVENLVRTSSILRAVRAKERHTLVERFVTRAFEAGERIIEQGQSSDGLHLIASGSVQVSHREEDGEELPIAELGVGEVVGEVALVLRRPSNADVVARIPTVTLHLPHSGFHSLIKEHPTLLAELYDLAVQRDEQTSSIVAQEATEVDDFVLI